MDDCLPKILQPDLLLLWGITYPKQQCGKLVPPEIIAVRCFTGSTKIHNELARAASAVASAEATLLQELLQLLLSTPI